MDKDNSLLLKSAGTAVATDSSEIQKIINLNNVKLLFASDSLGRNALHRTVLLCCKVSSSSNIPLISPFQQLEDISHMCLKNSPFWEDILNLLHEALSSVKALYKPAAAAEEKSHVQNVANNEKAVVEWFQNEISKKLVLLELSNEIFWSCLMSSRDCEGRTPLHYAVAFGNGKRVLDTLLTVLKVRPYLDQLLKSHAESSRLLRLGRLPASCIKKECMYDCQTGGEICTLQIHNSSDVSVHTQNFMRNGNSSHSKVDYDIIIPWLIKNICKRSTAFGHKLQLSSLDVLEELMEDEKIDSEKSGVLLVGDIKSLLAKLSIYVTEDVLKELCRRYFASNELIGKKWHFRKSLIKVKQRGVLLGQSVGERGSKAQGKQSSNRSLSSRSEMFESYEYDEDIERDDDDKYRQDFSTGIDRFHDEYMDSYQPQVRECSWHQSKESKRDSREDPGSDGDDGDYKHQRSSSRKQKFHEFDPTQSYYSRRMILELEEEQKQQDLWRDFGMDVFSFLAEIKRSLSLPSADLPDEENIDIEIKALEDTPTVPPTGEKSNTLAKADAAFDVDEFCAYLQGGNPWADMPRCVTKAQILGKRKQIVNGVDDEGRTPLFMASSLGQKTVAQLLMRHRADVTSATPSGETALSVAKDAAMTALLQENLLSWLHSNGSGSRRAPLDGEATLQSSSSSGAARDSDRTRLFMNLKPQLQHLKNAGWSYCRGSLSWAVVGGLTDVVQQLVESADVKNHISACDTTGRTALHECAATIGSTVTLTAIQQIERESVCLNSVPICELLVSSGADVNASSVSGRTPMHELFCRGQDEASAGSSGGNSYQDTKVSNANSNLFLNRTRCALLKCLLQWGANPLLKDRHGLCPVHYCARENVVDCMVELLRYKPTAPRLSGTLAKCPKVPYFPNNIGQSALHIACQNGCREVAQLLCRWDADWSIMFGPLLQGRGSSVSLLQLKDKMGKTAAQRVSPSITHSNCLQTMWYCCASGDEIRVAAILKQWKVLKKKRLPQVRSVDSDLLSELLSDENGPALSPTMRLESSAEAVDGNRSDPLLAPVSSSMPMWEDVDVLAAEVGQDANNTPKMSVAEDDALWMLDGVDAKTRMKRWTPLHCCVLGWISSCSPENTSAQKVINVKSSRSIRVGGRGNQNASSKRSDLTGYESILDSLFLNHAYVDPLDHSCRTPLFYAAAANLCSVVEKLIDKGAVVNCCDIDGNTPLHFSYATGATACVVLLELHGADQSALNMSSQSCLEVAGNISCLRSLL